LGSTAADVRRSLRVICVTGGKVESVSGDDLLSGYNYDAFVPENFERWLNFEASPPLGQKAPDFPAA
jgi:hypothetical protein